MAEEEGPSPGPRMPTEEELRDALDRVGVADILVNALSATASLGFRRVSPEARDLPQARLAIEALRALEPVLKDGGADEGLVRDLEQARMNLQLAYAAAVAEQTAAGENTKPAEETPAEETEPEETPAEETATEEAAEEETAAEETAPESTAAEDEAGS